MSAAQSYPELAAQRLRTWSARIDRLEARITAGDRQAPAEEQAMIEALKQQRAELAARIAEARRGGPATWEDVAASFERAGRRLSAVLEGSAAKN